ncbi:MAG TPA: phosphoglucosamine mutase [Gammaproteobacteria bacterium]|nr:phosphoglucosamine mutase [Gammaproteobacteria bacterium]
MTKRKKRYFGTDGIRGKIGSKYVNPDFVLKLGWAVGRVLAKKQHSKVLIGKDTRISGYMLESALQAGLSAAGVDVLLVGPMPTPGIAYLTRTFHAQAGIVISASHNQYHDNGIKFFSHEGKKLPDDVELAIEAMLDEKQLKTVDSEQLGKAYRIDDANGRYIEFCKSSVPLKMHFTDLKIVLDCANGATYHIAPNVFRELGAEVIVMGDQPNGLNINQDCGATQPALLQQAVLAHQADLGIALDGDGDRLIMVDETGARVDGDQLLYIIARSQKLRGKGQQHIVGTLMSNIGLEHAIEDLGLTFHRSKVGDRYVIEMLQSTGGVVGGESSGHIICLEKTTTGDGIIAALQILCEIQRTGHSLHELSSLFTLYPQTLLAVDIQQPIALSDPAIVAAVTAAEKELADTGRVLLRPSGTEPVIRVMVEGQDKSQTQRLAIELKAVIDSLAQGHRAD